MVLEKNKSLQLTNTLSSNWNKKDWSLCYCYKLQLKVWLIFGGLALEKTPQWLAALVSVHGSPGLVCGGGNVSYESMWRQNTHELVQSGTASTKSKAGPFPTALPSNVSIEWQWSPNKMLECCVKIWHVTHAFLWRGWGYITNTREEMLWRHAVGHHNWARKLPVVWKWRTQTQIKLDGHIVGQCFGHI